MKRILSRPALVIVLSLALSLTGCATTGSVDSRDPFEGLNRGVYSFNKTVDSIVIDPLTGIYRAITPDFVDRGITNFFSNLNDISVIVNDLMQLKVEQAVEDTLRFVFNTTVGLFGFFDVASAIDMPKHKEDFGQTLATWGVGSGPYLMMPLFGPTTLRDTSRFPVDGFLLNPVSYLESDSLKIGLFGLNYADVKSDLRKTTELAEQVSLDEYEFIKNAYFEQRETLINDGSGELEEFPDF